ncbi:LPS export ABC transporter periplasmic protein LptC [Desulfovibrio sp. OttesenSCG-928-F20]|nr:LPS export ABC transporter periplasmic protein LptC [Desulfovibrio sp. OttesenSCG-928-M16]MDL2290599.1 LPS export ABC transporter periplasmic protein LptC [Desulfovibrio sp. OttesenSCG-928-F20]
MLKSRPVLFGLAFLFCALFVWALWPERTSVPVPGSAQNNSTIGVLPDGANAAGKDESALNLALKSISLSQGEGGFELWRLKAEWANMYKEGGLILVVQPRLTYFLRDDDQIMYVQSDRGDISQEDQILRFIDKVRVTLADKVLSGELLVYNGTSRSMTLPQGGDFVTISSKGRADRIVWHIDGQLIEASGNVQVDMNSQ